MSDAVANTHCVNVCLRPIKHQDEVSQKLLKDNPLLWAAQKGKYNRVSRLLVNPLSIRSRLNHMCIHSYGELRRREGR